MSSRWGRGKAGGSNKLTKFICKKSVKLSSLLFGRFGRSVQRNAPSKFNWDPLTSKHHHSCLLAEATRTTQVSGRTSSACVGVSCWSNSLALNKTWMSTTTVESAKFFTDFSSYVFFLVSFFFQNVWTRFYCAQVFTSPLNALWLWHTPSSPICIAWQEKMLSKDTASCIERFVCIKIKFIFIAVEISC